GRVSGGGLACAVPDDAGPAGPVDVLRRAVRGGGVAGGLHGGERATGPGGGAVVGGDDRRGGPAGRAHGAEAGLPARPQGDVVGPATAHGSGRRLARLRAGARQPEEITRRAGAQGLPCFATNRQGRTTP